jgi:cytochrome c5
MKSMLVILCFALMSAIPGYGQTAPATNADGTEAQSHKSVVDQYCVTCHSDRVNTANMSLENADFSEVANNAESWERVIRKLRAGVMPPAGASRPSDQEYEALRDWLENQIDSAAAGNPNPGSTVMHRMNRAEYANAVRDLTDIEIDPAMFLPPDDSANGFDNVAGSLTLSPTLLESYITAAARIARMAVGYWKSPTQASYIASGDTSQSQHIEGLPFGTRGGMLVRHNFPADGEYRFSVQNYGLGSYHPNEQIEFLVDSERVGLATYAGVGTSSGMSAENDGSIDVTAFVKAGTHSVGATFIATNYHPSLNMVKEYDRKSLENNSIAQLQYPPAIGFFRISGPFGAERPVDSPSIRKVLTCRPENASQEAACADQIVSELARKAYRRPVDSQDLEAIMEFYLEGRSDGTFEDGIELALRRILASPQFLVRFETEPADLAVGETYRIDDLELASRLSFFLWSSIPDDELIDLAAEGRLSDPTVLRQQVSRMLEDPKSEAVVENFASQLLYLRNLPVTFPDGKFYPNWDDELRQSFRRETELLFESIMREDRSIVELLTADYTFINQRLAQHYGIPGIYGSHFRRVDLGPELDYRRGLLGKGSFLSITFTQNFRTSPVKRGVWILENILGSPAPAPPPNVPALEDTGSDDGRVPSLREQMTLHRQNEPCSTCHKLMDPMGFALENFDADGSWRTDQGDEAATPFDTSVELFDGSQVTGPIELREFLLGYTPQYVRTITEKMMTYALGRGVEYSDMPVVRSIVQNAESDNYRFGAIVMGIIESPQFLTRMKTGETLAAEE